MKPLTKADMDVQRLTYAQLVLRTGYAIILGQIERKTFLQYPNYSQTDAPLNPMKDNT